MTSEEISKPDFKELAEKLDKDLDDYISGLKKSPYKDGWPEDRWQEEIEKHPFFMSKPPAENEELPPLIEGLQQLKYDENENSPDELATTHKEDGNFSFKCKKYKDAITSYTAGVKCNCSDELKAQLYNNIAASHFFLKNYRSAINACKEALKLKNAYLKAEVRMAQCYYNLENYEDCIRICNEILTGDNINGSIISLRKNAIKQKELKDCLKRKQKKAEYKKNSEEIKLLETLVDRNIKVAVSATDFRIVTNLSQLQPIFSNLPLQRVHLKNEILSWSVVFLYPEYNIVDCIEEFEENHTFQHHLEEMFAESPEWDVSKKYDPGMINLYYKDYNNENVSIASHQTLKEVLQHDRFILRDGVPLFYLVIKNSVEEIDFLSNKCYF